MGSRITLEERYLHQGEVFLFSISSSTSRKQRGERIILSSKYMTLSEYVNMYFCKDNDKFVRSSNYLAWKKRTDLNLIENEVMEHVKGSITKPRKEYSQSLAKNMEGEVRAQRILIKSIKYPLILYVSKLETSKEIYDKLVELYSIRTAR